MTRQDNFQANENRPEIGRRTFLGGLGAIGVGTLGFASPAMAGDDRAAALSVGAYPADVSHTWTAGLYDAVLAEGLTPPNAARTYAYCAIAMYEAAVPGMARHRSLAGQLTGLATLPDRGNNGRLDWPMAISASVYRVSSALFATATAPTLALLAATHDGVRNERLAAGVPSRQLEKAIAHGERVGQALVTWIQDDGYRGILGRPYVPPTGPSLWTSTPPNFGTAIEPYWAEVRPMVLRTADEVVPEPHVPFSEAADSAFGAQAATVRETVLNLTDDQRSIARFWTDNPRLSGLPAGHWHLLVSHLARLRSLRLDATLEAQVRAAVALHDAFLNCWTWKYRLNLLRPVTYIRRYVDPEFSTFVNTPQFPEYTSGHSVASAAAATVLTDLFGSVAFTDDSHAPRNLPARHFSSIWAAAEEAARSRLYGGIHYPMGIEAGVSQGREIGDLVLSRLHTRR